MQLLMFERDFSALNQVRIGQIIAKKEDILDKKRFIKCQTQVSVLHNSRLLCNWNGDSEITIAGIIIC